MKKTFWCKIGLHNWTVTDAVYESAEWERISIALKEATRECTCCGKLQIRDRVCLGLNPPEYFDTWYNYERPNIILDKK